MSNNYEVDILVNDKPIKKFAHQNRIFVESRHGCFYGIRIKNNGHKRILAVVSIDGINVVNGQAAGSNKAGYVIEGYSSYTVPGWRTDNAETNAFKFNPIQRSYANKSDETQGDTTNCGIIGVRVYEEKEKPAPQVIWRTEIVEKPVYIPTPAPNPWRKPFTPWYGDPSYRYDMVGSIVPNTTSAGDSCQWKTATSHLGEAVCCSMNMSCSSEPTRSASSSSPQVMNFCSSVQDEPAKTVADFDTGTEFSNKTIHDVVHEVEFDTGKLLKTIEIHYATLPALKNMGVEVDKKPQVSFPKAFPNGFCKPPRN